MIFRWARLSDHDPLENQTKNSENQWAKFTYDINGNNPRIVIDIMDVLPCKGRYRTPVNGKLIKQIRAYYHKDSDKLRVVLDLYPGRDYVLSQLQISEKFLIELKPSENANFE